MNQTYRFLIPLSASNKSYQDCSHSGELYNFVICAIVYFFMNVIK